MTALDLTSDLLTDIVEESGITKIIIDMKEGMEKYDRDEMYNNEEYGISLKKIDWIMEYYNEKLKIYLDEQNNKHYTALAHLFKFATVLYEDEHIGKMTVEGKKYSYGHKDYGDADEKLFKFFLEKIKDYKDGDEITVNFLQINMYFDDYFSFPKEELREYYGLKKNDEIPDYMDMNYGSIFCKKKYSQNTYNFIEHLCKYHDVKITVEELDFRVREDGVPC